MVLMATCEDDLTIKEYEDRLLEFFYTIQDCRTYTFSDAELELLLDLCGDSMTLRAARAYHDAIVEIQRCATTSGRLI